MAKIHFNTNTTKNFMENGPDEEQEFKRGYLGMSGLAADCPRSVWYSFRFATKKKISPRLKRIFERGDIEEARVIRDLKEIGVEVFRRDEETGEKVELFGHIGERQERVPGFAGHAAGHPDGRLLGVIESSKTEHLLEVKTMNDRRFKNFQKNGVKISDPVYYGQIQRLMKGMKLKRCLFTATNKNTEEREYERVYLDNDYAEELKEREYSIIASDEPYGERFSRAHQNCKWCNHFSVCHDDAAPVKTCRSCEYVDLATEGKWLCSLNNDKELSLDDQIKACKQYRRLF